MLNKYIILNRRTGKLNGINKWKNNLNKPMIFSNKTLSSLRTDLDKSTKRFILIDVACKFGKVLKPYK